MSSYQLLPLTLSQLPISQCRNVSTKRLSVKTEYPVHIWSFPPMIHRYWRSHSYSFCGILSFYIIRHDLFTTNIQKTCFCKILSKLLTEPHVGTVWLWAVHYDRWPVWMCQQLYTLKECVKFVNANCTLRKTVTREHGTTKKTPKNVTMHTELALLLPLNWLLHRQGPCDHLQHLLSWEELWCVKTAIKQIQPALSLWINGVKPAFTGSLLIYYNLQIICPLTEINWWKLQTLPNSI